MNRCMPLLLTQGSIDLAESFRGKTGWSGWRTWAPALSRLHVLFFPCSLTSSLMVNEYLTENATVFLNQKHILNTCLFDGQYGGIYDKDTHTRAASSSWTYTHKPLVEIGGYHISVKPVYLLLRQSKVPKCTKVPVIDQQKFKWWTPIFVGYLLPHFFCWIIWDVNRLRQIVNRTGEGRAIDMAQFLHRLSIK